MKRAISRFFFERFSTYYDWLLSTPFQIELRRDFIDFLELSKTDSLVEIGCGPGNFLSLVVQHCGQLTGVDASSQMIDLARKRTANLMNHATRLVNADIASFAYRQRFDHAIGVSFLYLSENRLQTINQMVATLRPGGTISLMEPSYNFTQANLADCLTQKRFSPKDRFSAYNWLRSVQFHGKFTEKDLTRLFSKAGISDVRLQKTFDGMVIFVRGVRN